MVINVPTDLTHIQIELPRNFLADDTVVVNLKRRLRYKGLYDTKNVCPYKILRALQYLVSHKTLWKEAGVQLRSEFLTALETREGKDARPTTPEIPCPEQYEPGDACSDDDESSEGDEPDAHAFGDESLLDADADNVDVRNAVINVAPAEGQRPVSVYLDTNAEEMAYPDIFGGCARPVNRYSYKQLCRVELRHF
jgi:hypothetical protein